MSAQPTGRPPGRPAAPPIVVGYDHHPSSASALGMALSMAAALGAPLHVVHVVDLDDAYPNIDDPAWEARTQATVDAEQNAAETVLAGFGGTWSYQTCRGQAAQVLARIALEQHALMIVIGERRAGPATAVVHLLERSVLHHLLHLHPTTPVLVVPERARPAAFVPSDPT